VVLGLSSTLASAAWAQESGHSRTTNLAGPQSPPGASGAVRAGAPAVSGAVAPASSVRVPGSAASSAGGASAAASTSRAAHADSGTDAGAGAGDRDHGGAAGGSGDGDGGDATGTAHLPEQPPTGATAAEPARSPWLNGPLPALTMAPMAPTVWFPHSPLAYPAPSGSAGADISPGAHGSAVVTPASSAHGAGDAEAVVRILDRRVVTLTASRAGQTAQERAKEATRSLEKILEEDQVSDVRVDQEGDVAVLYVGPRPFLQLGAEDVTAAGDASLEMHANGVAAKVRDALKAERNRAAIAKQAFSFSLMIFAGLMAALLMRRARDLLHRLGTWVDEHPDEVPRVEVRGLTLVGPAIVRGAMQVAVGGGRVAAVVLLVFGWVLFSLSLWDTTRPYTGKLTNFLWDPLRSITERLVASLPVTVIGLLGVAAVGLLVRFVGVFFRSVAEGETSLDWLPQDLAAPTGVLARVAVVLGSTVFLLPTFTGREDGPMARLGLLALGALALASTPLLATTAMGIVVVYGRRLRVGEFAELGAHRGRVVDVGLLEVRLESADQSSEVRVPHLRSLLSPTVLLGRFPIVAVEVMVTRDADRKRTEDALLEATQGIGTRPGLEMLHTGPAGTRYRLSVGSELGDGRGRLLRAVLAALDEKGIALGADGAKVL
jgi:hypothetical protein